MSGYGVNEGDKVIVTVKGVVTRGGVDTFEMREETSGIDYYFRFDRLTNVTVEDPEYVEGQPYVDGDGDVFLRRYESEGMAEPWIDAYGSTYRDDELTAPVKHITEDLVAVA